MVPERHHPSQGLYDRVDVVGARQVVQPHEAREVGDAEDVSRQGRVLIQTPNGLIALEARVQAVLDVLQRRVHDLVVVRQTVDALGGEVDEHMVHALHAVRVRRRVRPSALKVLATD
eukprot:scaffold1505_cov256-Pinguiococcus_pyrenoidosus.AAC.3